MLSAATSSPGRKSQKHFISCQVVWVKREASGTTEVRKIIGIVACMGEWKRKKHCTHSYIQGPNSYPHHETKDTTAPSKFPTAQIGPKQ